MICLLNDITDLQKENLILFLKLYKKSVDRNEMFMRFYEPISIVECRNKIISQLIDNYV